MNFVKWMRKNNTKIMAVVVIVLMVGFVGGSSLTYLLSGSGGAKRTVAYYGEKQKITPMDRSIAGQELDLLAAIRADDVLRSQDLRGLLLGELLFAQNRNAAAALAYARQTIQQRQYRISEKQLADMYRSRTVPSDIYWLLLREEAAKAGIHVRTEDVGQLLAQIVPQLFEGRTYGEMMASWVNHYNVPEETILATFGKLLAVLQYAQIISSMENVTAAQIRHMAVDQGEVMDVELVQFEASNFADKSQTLVGDAILKQFNRYKSYFPGEISEANPFGFGYRLPDRVQLDYVAVKLDDVASIIKPPTQEEAEQYYQQNRERQFTEEVPADPNDPNSPMIPQSKSYVEVAQTIMDQLRQQRITTKAEQILQEARNLADADLQAAGADGNVPSVEQRAQMAVDYVKIAQDLGQKHDITLYSGRTGLLSAVDVQGGEYLRRMALTGYGRNPVPLTQVLFSTDAFGEDATTLFSMPRAELYISIGPARDPMGAVGPDLSGQIMLLTRVIRAEPEAVPQDLEVAYSTETIRLGEASDEDAKTFSVQEEVTKDLRMLAAWDTTRSRAEEFMALATKEGWDSAVAQFNQLYGQQAKEKPDDPNVFAVNRLNGVQRISKADLQVLAAQVANNPAQKTIMNSAQLQGRFVDRLLTLVPQGGQASGLPTTVEFKPNRSFYVLKSLSRDEINQQEFRQMKGMLLGREETSQAQSLAVVHLNPENILKRMNFRPAEPTDQPAEEQSDQKSEEAS